MALNVELIAGPGREQMPQPFDGEVFILSRDGLALEISHGPTRRPPMKGVLYVTNMRMVLVVDSKHIATAQCESMELPFQGIEEESFNQPIFGTNNLSGRCKPYDNQPFHGEIRFRLKFYEGGVGTFLPIFNSVLGATRRILYQRRQQEQQGSVQDMPQQTLTNQVISGQFQQSAYVDPSDPTRLYVTQPLSSSVRQRTSTAHVPFYP